MLELGGAHPSAAMVSMNQLKVNGPSTTTFKRRKKSTGLPNPKKMFEEVTLHFTSTDSCKRDCIGSPKSVKYMFYSCV